MSNSFPQSLLVIGSGNMAGAMLRGWFARGLDPASVTVVDPSPRELPEGVRHLTTIDAGISAPDWLLLGIKPQMLRDVAPHLATLDLSNTLLVSMLAGVEIAGLRAAVPGVGAIARIMPNMAIGIGQSVTALFAETLDQAERDRIETLFAMLGTAEWLDDESQMHVVTALSGSGPAYLFRFLDALAKGAITLGMPEDQAARLALGMVRGSAELVLQSAETPAQLAERVASPAGTTRAALHVFDADDALDRLVADAMAAAAKRSVELGQ
ncbi:pyrroline-5-carboxylate reductase [Blastomonas aquatica]|uniref:Pyrroline-5-carboxylate reductase n=1 Tax=Blastomonas aquatica TaxID=1510276 RepID=A0ABQ1J1A0_9SPHN|nr:pyrroline-5-carboxylate reductase [Blastomonas aquatica]GGB57472.1 pyrroline-5-carboxylate reductase [Blastomonas aquatica]